MTWQRRQGVPSSDWTRFKSRGSTLSKLTRFQRPDSPHFRLARFNDALRYTVVYPDLIYWRAVEAALCEFDSGGWAVRAIARGWQSRGYKAVNVTIRTPSGFLVEVQFHTAGSLTAAERTHRIYEEQRELRRGSKRWRDLERIQQEAWSSVPVPPGRLELS